MRARSSGAKGFLDESCYRRCCSHSQGFRTVSETSRGTESVTDVNVHSDNDGGRSREQHRMGDDTSGVSRSSFRSSL